MWVFLHLRLNDQHSCFLLRTCYSRIKIILGFFCSKNCQKSGVFLLLPTNIPHLLELYVEDRDRVPPPVVSQVRLVPLLHRGGGGHLLGVQEPAESTQIQIWIFLIFFLGMCSSYFAGGLPPLDSQRTRAESPSCTVSPGCNLVKVIFSSCSTCTYKIEVFFFN